MMSIGVVGLVVASLFIIRMMPNPTEMDILFCVISVLWAIYEAGDNEKHLPDLTTWVRRLGLVMSSVYLTWIATSYTN
jgi:hypothetical protein